MISETGQNLSVLIVTQSDKNWETFATWYSFYRNLPDASVSVICQRNDTTPFMYYQWAKRLKIPTVKHTPSKGQAVDYGILESIKEYTKSKTSENLLIVKPFVMALDILSTDKLARMNSIERWIDEEAWFLHNPDIDSMLNEYMLEGKRPEPSLEPLCVDARENGLSCLVSYRKGCGKWINTSKGCPFSSAGCLVSVAMTANEHRIIELWKRMVALYKSVV